MEVQFNSQHGCKKRTYKCGDPVYAKLYKRNKMFWSPGIVKAVLGNVDYEVEIENFSLFKAVHVHTNQLRYRYVESKLQRPVIDSLLEYFNIPGKYQQQTPCESAAIETTNECSSADITETLPTDTSVATSNEPGNIVVTPLEHPASQATHCAETTTPLDESSSLRKSTRRKRPPAWVPDYHLPKKKGRCWQH